MCGSAYVDRLVLSRMHVFTFYKPFLLFNVLVALGHVVIHAPVALDAVLPLVMLQQVQGGAHARHWGVVGHTRVVAQVGVHLIKQSQASR